MVPLSTLSTVTARTQMDAKNKTLLIAEAFLRDVNMPCINVSYFLTWVEHTWVTQLHPPKSPHLYRKIPPPLSHTQPDQEVVTKTRTCWFYHYDSKLLSPQWKKCSSTSLPNALWSHLPPSPQEDAFTGDSVLRTDLALKTKYQHEVQIAFHHKTAGGATRSDTKTSCSFQVEVQWGRCSPPHKDKVLLPLESRCSIWLALLFLPWKEEPFKSQHCHLSSKPSLYATKDKKGKGCWRSHQPRFLTSGFGQQRTFELQPCFFNKKLQRKDLATREQQLPAAEKSRQHHSSFNKPKAKRAQRNPSSQSAPALLSTQKLFRRNLWVSIHWLFEVTTDTNCTVFSSLLFCSR